MRKTRAPTQSQRAIGHITALPFIATMFVMYAMVGRSTLQFKMPRLDAYAPGPKQPNGLAVETADGNPRRKHSRSAVFNPIQIKIDS